MKPKEMLKGRLLTMDDLKDFKKQVAKLNKKVGFVAGNWDLIHIGQMRYLAEAKKTCDVLVVAVQSNEAVKAVKGPNKPVLDEMIRTESLAFLKSVDYLIINPTPSCKAIVDLLEPDVFISTIDEWSGGYKESKEYKTVEAYGGQFVMIERQSLTVSTTQIMERIIAGKIVEMFGDTVDKSHGPVKERYSKE